MVVNLYSIVLTSPPFEVHETGWGEFEIQIKIFFTDTTEKPVCVSMHKHGMHYSLLFQVTLYHLLRLFQADPLVMAGKKNVVSEQYDEMVQDVSVVNLEAFMN